MATDHHTADEHGSRAETGDTLRNGAILMALAGIAFVGYGVVFLVLAFVGDGFELGVSTLDGLTRSELANSNPETANYIKHLHVATAAFIVSIGFAVATLSWYGVRRGQLWAWITAVVAPVIALALALPMHYTGDFHYHWETHLAPIYVATIVMVIGAVLAFQALREDPSQAA